MENGRASPRQKPRSPAQLRGGTNDDHLRRRIAELKKELESERRQSKQAHREKVAGIKAARDEEKTRAVADRDELLARLTKERKEELKTTREEMERRRDAELVLYQRQHEEKLDRLRKRFDAEKSDLETRMRDIVYGEARREIGAEFEAERKKLMREVFELNRAKSEAEKRATVAVGSDREKAEKLRRADAERDDEIQRLTRDARMENRKQMEELRSKERLLHQKEQELGQVKRNMAVLKMENEKLAEKLKRTQEAESWQKMSPRAPLPGIGDASFDATSPRLKQYDDDEKKRIARNAELSLLSRRLEEKNTALTKENADLQTELDKAKMMKEPLETKCDKLMKKNNVLSSAVRDRDRRLKETTEENSQLKEANASLEQNVEKLEKSAHKRPGNRAEKLAVYYKNEMELRAQEVEERNRVIAKLKEKNVNLRQRLEVLKSSRKSLMKEREEKLTSPGPANRSWDEESVSTLHDDLDQAVFDKDEMETKYKELMREWLKAQRSYAQLQHKLATSVDIEREKMMREQMRGDLDTAELMIETLKKDRLKEKDAEEEARSKERDEYEEKIKSLTDQLYQAEEQLQKAEESLLESNKSLHEELQSVNSSFGEKEQELEQLREQCKNVEEELWKERRAREEAAKSLAEASESFKEKAKLFDAKEQEADAQINELNSQLAQRREDAQEEIVALKLKIETAERERDEANRSHALRIADLEKSLGEIAKTKDDGEREQDESLRSLRAKLDRVSAQLESEKQRGDGAVERLKEMESESVDLKLQAERSAETSKLLALTEQKINKLEGDLECLENQLAEQVLQLEESKEHNKVLLDIEAKLREEIKVLQEKVNAMAAPTEPLQTVQLSFLRVQEEELADEDLNEHQLVIRERIRELETIIKGTKFELIEEEASRIMTLKNQDSELKFAEEKHKEAEESLGKLLDEQMAFSGEDDPDGPPLPKTKPPTIILENDETDSSGLEKNERIRQRIREEMRDNLEAEFEERVSERVEERVMEQLEERLEVEMKKRIEREETTMRDELKAEFEERVSERVEERVREQVKERLEVEMKKRIEGDETMTRKRLEVEIEAKVSERVKKEVRKDLEETLRKEAKRDEAEMKRRLEMEFEMKVDERMREQRQSENVSDTVAAVERKAKEKIELATEAAREECQREIKKRVKMEESFSILQARYARLESELSEQSQLKERSPPPLENEERKRLEALLRKSNASVKGHQLEMTRLQKERDEVTKKNVLLTEQAKEGNLAIEAAQRLRNEVEDTEMRRAQELEQYEASTQMHAEEVRRERLIRMESEQRLGPLKNENTLLQRKCQAKDEIIADLNKQLGKLKKALTGSLLEDLSIMDAERPTSQPNRLKLPPHSQLYGSMDIDEALRTIDAAEKETSAAAARSSSSRAARPLSASAAMGRQRYSGSVSSGRLSRGATRSRSGAPSSFLDDKRMFVVLFDYDPDSLCTTKQPELELTVNAGDVIAVTGDMDDNGLYLAEFEGKRGLIPANFVEEIDILDPMCKSRLVSEVSTPDPAAFPSLSAAESRHHAVDLADWNGELPYDQEESENGTLMRSPTPEDDPDAPEQLCVERQLDNSLLVAWKPPDITPLGKNSGTVVAGYKVLVDGREHQLIIGAEQSKALLEDFDVSVPRRITLQTVGRNGRLSSGVSMTFSGASPSSVSSSQHPQQQQQDRGFMNGPHGGDDLQSLGGSVTTFDDAIEPFGLYVAVYDYDPYTMSPNPDPEAELAFKEGDLIKVFGDENDDGFFNAKLNGKEGLIPSNFVEHVSSPSRTHPPMPNMFSSSTIASSAVPELAEESDFARPRDEVLNDNEDEGEDYVDSDPQSEISSDAATNAKSRFPRKLSSIVATTSSTATNGVSRNERVSFPDDESDPDFSSEEGKTKRKRGDMISRGRKFFKKISSLRRNKKADNS